MIQVTTLDTVELATYNVRTFALYKVRTLCILYIWYNDGGLKRQECPFRHGPLYINVIAVIYRSFFYVKVMMAILSYDQV